jgi:hypothetical protein
VITVDEPMPALTGAEADVVDRFLAAVDSLGRINPARTGQTLAALAAAQALVSHACALRDALDLMLRRGEQTIYTTTLSRALRVLDAERRIARIAEPHSPERS